VARGRAPRAAVLRVRGPGLPAPGEQYGHPPEIPFHSASTVYTLYIARVYFTRAETTGLRFFLVRM